MPRSLSLPVASLQEVLPGQSIREQGARRRRSERETLSLCVLAPRSLHADLRSPRARRGERLTTSAPRKDDGDGGFYAQRQRREEREERRVVVSQDSARARADALTANAHAAPSGKPAAGAPSVPRGSRALPPQRAKSVRVEELGRRRAAETADPTRRPRSASTPPSPFRPSAPSAIAAATPWVAPWVDEGERVRARRLVAAPARATTLPTATMKKIQLHDSRI